MCMSVDSNGEISLQTANTVPGFLSEGFTLCEFKKLSIDSLSMLPNDSIFIFNGIVLYYVASSVFVVSCFKLQQCYNLTWCFHAPQSSNSLQALNLSARIAAQSHAWCVFDLWVGDSRLTGSQTNLLCPNVLRVIEGSMLGLLYSVWTLY